MKGHSYPNELRVEEARAALRTETEQAWHYRVVSFDPALFPRHSKPGRLMCSSPRCTKLPVVALIASGGGSTMAKCEGHFHSNDPVPELLPADVLAMLTSLHPAQLATLLGWERVDGVYDRWHRPLWQMPAP